MPASMSGRPQKLSDQDRKRLKRDLSSNRHTPLASLCNNVTPSVCVSTLYKEIHEFGINSCIVV